AVQRDEASVAARAVVMDRPRRQLLARPCFAGDQHRARRGRDGLEKLKQLPHARAAADDALESIPLLELRPQIGVLALQAALLHCRIEYMEQGVELKRFRNEV